MSALHGPPLRIALETLRTELGINVGNIEGFGPVKIHLDSPADVELVADRLALRGPILGNVVTASGRVAGTEVMFVSPRIVAA